MNVSDKRAIEAAINVAASAAQQKERDYPRAPARMKQQRERVIAKRCQDCRTTCTACGEWITDPKPGWHSKR
jgi:hypothetical protein